MSEGKPVPTCLEARRFRTSRIPEVMASLSAILAGRGPQGNATTCLHRFANTANFVASHPQVLPPEVRGGFITKFVISFRMELGNSRLWLGKELICGTICP